MLDNLFRSFYPKNGEKSSSLLEQLIVYDSLKAWYAVFDEVIVLEKMRVFLDNVIVF